MNIPRPIELNGVEVLSIRPSFRKHYYTSGVDITPATTFGNAKGTLRTSSYNERTWEVVVSNKGSVPVNVTLDFSLLDRAGVTVQKQSLWFNSLEAGETMKQMLEPIGGYRAIKLKRMMVGRESLGLDHSLAIPKPGRTVPLVIFCLVSLIAFLLFNPHYETIYYQNYPEIDVIKEADLYLTPDGEKVQKLKPGAFLRLVDKTSGPERVNNKGIKVKWYKVATGIGNPARWIKSDAVHVTEKHNPSVTTEKVLRWGR